MDRSGVKNFPSSWGGGLFCHKNQGCSKLPEMDRSDVKNFPLILGGGGLSATKTKVAQNFLKWINLMSKIFPLSGGGGRGGSAQFSGIIIFSLELYLGDQLCPKCTKNKKVLSVTRLMRYRPIKIIS